MAKQNGVEPQLASEAESSNAQVKRQGIDAHPVSSTPQASPEVSTAAEKTSATATSEEKQRKEVTNTPGALQSAEEKGEDENKEIVKEDDQKKKTQVMQEKELPMNTCKTEPDIHDQKKDSKSSKASLGILPVGTKTSTIIPSEEKKKENIANTSGTVPYAEKKKGMEGDQMKKTKVMQEDAITKTKSNGEGIPDDNKGKTWIWWGVLGGLMLVIGGVLKMVKASKIQQAGGERQEKQIQSHGDVLKMVKASNIQQVGRERQEKQIQSHGDVLKMVKASKIQQVGGERQETQIQSHGDVPIALVTHESN